MWTNCGTRMEETRWHELSVSIPFPSAANAQLVKQVIQVDKPLKPSELTRSLTVNESTSTLLIEFKARTIAQARVALDHCLSDVQLIVQTMHKFGPKKDGEGVKIESVTVPFDPSSTMAASTSRLPPAVFVSTLPSSSNRPLAFAPVLALRQFPPSPPLSPQYEVADAKGKSKENEVERVSETRSASEVDHTGTVIAEGQQKNGFRGGQNTPCGKNERPTVSTSLSTSASDSPMPTPTVTPSSPNMPLPSSKSLVEVVDLTISDSDSEAPAKGLKPVIYKKLTKGSPPKKPFVSRLPPPKSSPPKPLVDPTPKLLPPLFPPFPLLVKADSHLGKRARSELEQDSDAEGTRKQKLVRTEKACQPDSPKVIDWPTPIDATAPPAPTNIRPRLGTLRCSNPPNPFPVSSESKGPSWVYWIKPAPAFQKNVDELMTTDNATERERLAQELSPPAPSQASRAGLPALPLSPKKSNGNATARPTAIVKIEGSQALAAATGSDPISESEGGSATSQSSNQNGRPITPVSLPSPESVEHKEREISASPLLVPTLSSTARPRWACLTLAPDRLYHLDPGDTNEHFKYVAEFHPRTSRGRELPHDLLKRQPTGLVEETPWAVRAMDPAFVEGMPVPWQKAEWHDAEEKKDAKPEAKEPTFGYEGLHRQYVEWAAERKRQRKEERARKKKLAKGKEKRKQKKKEKEKAAES